jgi:hypothetical protein
MPVHLGIACLRATASGDAQARKGGPDTKWAGGMDA